MCMITDADAWTIFVDAIRTARKTHRCGECGRAIQPGERYHHARGLLDGGWMQVRQCLHCHHAALWLGVICRGWVYGDVCEDLVEHWEEYPSRDLARLTSGIKLRWHDGRDTVPVWAEDAARGALELQRQRVQAGLTVTA